MTDDGRFPPKRLAIETSDGLALRAEQAGGDDPTYVAVLCHPHPLHGGNMYASIIDTLFDHTVAEGAAAVRFNFRGVDGSDGQHDYGQGERLDVMAVIDYAVSTHPGTPLLLTGWSFGADVALAVDHPAVDAWVAIAPPLRHDPAIPVVASEDARPTFLLVPEHDQFNSPTAAEATTVGWEATTIMVVGGADHFLTGATDDVCRLIDQSAASVLSD